MPLAQSLNIFQTGLIAEMQFGLILLQGLLVLTSLFLMMLILVQRGKGGGLTGALGGMGGQSAFGSKAGDAFTKITVITSVIWIMLCMLTIARFNPPPAPKTAADKTKSSMSSTDPAVEEEKGTSATKGGGATGAETTEAGGAETKTDEDSTKSGESTKLPGAAVDLPDAGTAVEGLAPETTKTDEGSGVELDLGGPESDVEKK